MSGPKPARSPEEAPPRVLALAPSAASRRMADGLAASGFEVRAARTPAELARLVSEGEYDVVLLDLDAPRSKPAALDRIARALETLPPDGLRRPCVLAVARSGAAALPDAHALGADAWIVAADPERVRRQVEAGAAARRLHAAREEIERLREAVTHARSTAHDLAQPLTTIMARAQLLLSRTPAEDPRHRPLAVICQEADRLAALIERFQALKAMAAVQAGPSRD